MLDRQPAQAVDFAADPAGSAWLKLDIGGHLLSASGTAARLFGHNDNDALVDARPDVNDLFADHSFFETIATRADPPKVLWLARRSDDELFVVTVCLTQRDASWYCILEPYIEAQQLHRALHEERARFAVLADISSNGIFMSDGEKFVYVNDAVAELLGYEKAELLGTPCANAVSPESRERMRLLGDHLQCGDPSVMTSVEVVMKDGIGRKNVSISISKIEFGGRPAYLSVVYDITDFCSREKALKDYARRLRRLSQQVLEVQENERRNLARELHDEIGQQLTLVKLSLARLAAHVEETAPVDDALNAVSTLMQQIRELSLDLRPSMLDDLGLGATLRWYVGRIARLASLETRVEIDSTLPRLSCEAETLFFRIAQEAVTNVMRHAGARKLNLELGCAGSKVELCVTDDGCGFDPHAARLAALDGNSAGLLGMQERAALGNAELTIDSKPGRGTTLRLAMSGKLAGIRGPRS